MNYWEKRASFLENKNFKKSNDLIRLIDKEHKLAMKKMESDIDYYLSRIAKEGNLSVAEARKLLSKGELDHFRMSLRDYIDAGKGSLTDEIKSQLELASNLHHISRQQAMAIELKKHIDSLYNKYLGETTKHLATSYEESFYHSLYDLGKFEGFKSFQKLNTSEIDSIIKRPWAEDGQNFSDRIWKNQEKLINSLQEELLGSAMRGDKIDRAVKNLAEKMEVSKSNASRLIRTESAFISNLAMTNAYEKGTCEKYEILATLDLKTSEICRHMDGKKFPFKDKLVGVNHPPFHPNCRTVTIPCYDDDIERRLDEKSGRLARDPETGKSKHVENLTYKEWYKKYVVNSDPNDYNISEHTFGKTKKFKNFEDFEEFIGLDNLFDFEDSVSTDEAKSIAFYSHTGDKQINSILRSGIADDDIKSYVQDLDNIISRFEVPEDVSLYRGSNLDFLYREFSINNLEDLLGKSYIDKGYTSTSIILDKAFLNKDAVFEIKLPGGKGRGAFISSFSRHFDELEFLLKRNTKFKIVDIREWYNPRQKKNVSYIVLEVCDV